MAENIDKKIKNNAMIAYIMIFFSWLLLFNKNEYINNKFVKGHIKSSIILHSFLLLNLVIFLIYDFLGRISLFGIRLNIVMANFFFILIGVLMIRGILSAYNGKELGIGESIKSTTTIGLDINNDNVVDEKDKLTIILSYIPFIGYIVGSKYSKLQNIIKLNLLFTLFIIFVYITGHDNISNLLLLLYIIYVGFLGISLYTKDELISISIPNYLTPKGLLINIKGFFLYLYHYFKGNFKNYNQIIGEINTKEELVKEKEITELKNLENPKMTTKMIYIPIINFIFLFEKENKYKYHIRNGLVISFIFIISIIFLLLGYINSRLIILLLFPICFGFGMLNISYYKMPFIYDIYILFVRIKNFFFQSKKKIDEKRKEVNEVNLKVK